MTKRHDRVSRRDEVTLWRASGDSAAGFARQRGYSVQSLRRWAAEVDAGAGESPRLVRLEVAAARPVASLVVEIPACGARVVVAPGFDVRHLQAVVAALGAEVVS
jgi:hypothetical protein